MELVYDIWIIRTVDFISVYIKKIKTNTCQVYGNILHSFDLQWVDRDDVPLLNKMV